MNIIEHLQAYLEELDQFENTATNHLIASRYSNLGRRVQLLIEQIVEFEQNN